MTGLGVVAVLEVGIVAFLLRAEDALQLPFGRLLYGDLSPIAGGTRFGTAFIAMTLGFALVAALLYLAWLLERRVLLWLAFALALVFASGLSLSGHSAADAGSSWKSRARGLGAPLRGVPVARRARAARARRLAARARAARARRSCATRGWRRC